MLADGVSKARGLSWSIFAGFEGRAVARDIALDGNTWSNSHSAEKHPLVADLYAGVTFGFGATRLAITQTYRTLEFVGQSEPQMVGAVTMSTNF